MYMKRTRLALAPLGALALLALAPLLSFCGSCVHALDRLTLLAALFVAFDNML